MFLFTVISTKLHTVVILNIRVNCLMALQNYFKNHRVFSSKNCQLN